MDNGIAFKSKINFVDRSTFNRLCESGYEYIDFDLKAPICITGDKFYTLNIKTYTGGIVTNAHDKAAGFHWLDDIENYLDMNRLCRCLLGKFHDFTKLNGLIIGSKNLSGREYSCINFTEINNILSNSLKHLSVFEEHTNMDGSTSFLYNLANDTITLCTSIIDKNGKYQNVSDIKSLKENFRYIKIADKDRLFINGKECTL